MAWCVIRLSADANWGVSVLYLTTKDITLLEVGYLKSFQALVILLLDIPFAYIADRTNKSLSIKLAILASALWLLLTGLGTQFYTFLIAEFFNAVSIALFSGAFIAMLLNGVANEHKQVVISNLQKKQHLFMAASALIGPFLIKEVHSSSPWYLSAVLMFCLLIFASVVLPNTENKTRKKIEGHIAYLSFVRNNFFALILLLSITYLYNVLINFWQPILYFGIGDVEAYYWGIFIFLILLSQSFAALITERFGKNNKAYVLCVIIATGLAITLITNETSQLLCYVILACVGVRIALIISSSWFHSQISDDFRATGDAIFNAISRLCIFLLLPVAGLVIGTI